MYRAERADGQFHKPVAIKLVPRGMDSDAIRRRFRHEQQILAGLDHPNIARLIDGGTTDFVFANNPFEIRMHAYHLTGTQCTACAPIEADTR